MVFAGQGGARSFKGMTMSKFDHSLFFMLGGNNVVEGLICVHVDDFFYCGSCY